MEKVRMGIIGIGNMGSGHVRSFLEGEIGEDVTLTAVADLRESRRQWAGEYFEEMQTQGIKIFEDDRALIRSGMCDAVMVEIPHYEHPEVSVRAMKQGLHVLCEKPAGVYAKQVRWMNEEALRSGCVFGLMFNMRADPVYRKMREVVQSGEMGEIKRVNWILTDWYRSQIYFDSGGWRGTWDGEGGGVLVNQCPHNLDILQWICGMPVRLQSFCHEGKWHDIEVEDDVTVYMEFPNGATGVFVTSTGYLPGTNRFEILMTKGKLVCEKGKLICFRLKEDERVTMFTTQDGFYREDGAYEEIRTESGGNARAKVIEAFAGRILRGTPLIAEGQEGINEVNLANAIHLSSWLKKEVTLPVDEELFLKELTKRRSASRRKTNVREITFFQ